MNKLILISLVIFFAICSKSWAEEDYNNKKQQLINDALKTAGSGNVVELWNGTAWSSGTNASDTKSNRGGLGTTSAGLLIGGEPPGTGVVNTEEWVAPTTSTVTFTVS